MNDSIVYHYGIIVPVVDASNMLNFAFAYSQFVL